MGPSNSRSKESPITTSTGKILHMSQKANPKKSSVADDPRVTQALQNYEAGLRALQEHKFEKAKPLFEKVLAGATKELPERASLTLSICNQHLERSTSQQFKSVEEH